jgi:hypothetical protein
MLLREARAVLRRIDVLAPTALVIDDPALPAIAELRASADRLVAQLAHRGQAQERQARQAVRRQR